MKNEKISYVRTFQYPLELRTENCPHSFCRWMKKERDKRKSARGLFSRMTARGARTCKFYGGQTHACKGWQLSTLITDAGVVCGLPCARAAERLMVSHLRFPALFVSASFFLRYSYFFKAYNFCWLRALGSLRYSDRQKYNAFKVTFFQSLLLPNFEIIQLRWGTTECRNYWNKAFKILWSEILCLCKAGSWLFCARLSTS